MVRSDNKHKREPNLSSINDLLDIDEIMSREYKYSQIRCGDIILLWSNEFKSFDEF